MIVLVDMDGVLVDGPIEPVELGEAEHWSDVPGVFKDLPPYPGALDAIRALARTHDVFIVSTAPWNNPSAWTDKVAWVRRHLPDFEKRLVLTHRKDLVRGDVIIDDRLKNGVERFPGEVILFGSPKYPDWSAVLARLDAGRQVGAPGPDVGHGVGHDPSGADR